MLPQPQQTQTQPPTQPQPDPTLHNARLYTFIDTTHLHHRDPAQLTQQLCDHGADIIQLRAKNLPPHQIRQLAHILTPITQKAHIPLIINDHPNIAQTLPNPHLHLGQEDFFHPGHTHITHLFPKQPRPKLGLSTHNPQQAQRALAAQPHYLAVGPIYKTPTKPHTKPTTLNYLHWATQNIPIPWFAIGGITLQTLPHILDAGAPRICILSAILDTPQPHKTCQTIRHHLDKYPLPKNQPTNPTPT